MIEIKQENLANLMETLECQEGDSDLYWSKEGNIYSLYSEAQEAYSKPIAVIEVI